VTFPRNEEETRECYEKSNVESKAEILLDNLSMKETVDEIHNCKLEQKRQTFTVRFEPPVDEQ
jgi:hypothetical protein